MAATKKINLSSFLQADDYQTKLESLSFEQGLQLLEDLVEKVETGEVELETVVNAYERGAHLLKLLREKLGGVETRIEQLQGELDEES